MLWTALIIFGLVAYFLLRKGYTSENGLKLILAGGLLVIGWLVLRPEQANIGEYNQFQAELGQGDAVLLELQSPF